MVTDRSSGLKLSAQFSTVKMSAMLAVGVALVAMPAFSQGAVTPGGGAIAPQPRVAPAPQAPVAGPQAPLTVAPNPAVAAPAKKAPGTTGTQKPDPQKANVSSSGGTIAMERK